MKLPEHHSYPLLILAALTLISIVGGEAETNIIVARSSNHIQITPLNSSSSRSVEIATYGIPAGVTYDADRAEVYWSIPWKASNYGILRASTNGSGAEWVVQFSDRDAVYGISYDWIAENIYYAGYEKQHVGVCSRKGGVCTILVQESNNIYGIAVDPPRGTMYWTSTSGAIRKGGMDGSSPMTIVNSSVINPHGMALDHVDARLYWADPASHSIHSCDLNGGGHRVVIALGSNSPYGVDILGDKVYWSERGANRIRRCSKVDATTVDTVNTMSSAPYFMAIFHGKGQPKNRVNHCAGKLCSHLCVLTPTNYFRCLCPKGLHLSADQKTCTATSSSASGSKNRTALCPCNSDGSNTVSITERMSISAPQIPDAAAPTFPCLNGENILSARVCNGKCDCWDGSDEGQGCHLPCANPISVSALSCRVSPIGPVYACAPGYRWSVPKMSCVDVDECAEGHPCPHYCLNLNGSFTCIGAAECPARFGNETCQEEILPPQLIYAWDGIIHSAPLNLSTSTRTKISARAPSGMDVNSWTGHVYWSSGKHGEVSRTDLFSGNSEVLISGLANPTHLAYDWVLNNLYIVTSSLGSFSGSYDLPRKIIKLCTVPNKGTPQMCTNLYTTVGPNVTYLAVAPTDQYVFWTEVFFEVSTGVVTGVIRRGRTDKPELIELVTNEVALPSGLVVDQGSKRVFWLDAKMQRVEAVNFDGTNRAVITSSSVSLKARSLALMGSIIMWADDGGLVTCSITSDTKCLNRTLANAEGARAFKILHRSLQIPGVNPCHQSKCSHICTGARRDDATTGAYKCYCPEGYLSHDVGQKVCTLNSIASVFSLVGTKDGYVNLEDVRLSINRWADMRKWQRAQ